MANLTRCDECKRLSDEQGIGYIGKYHRLMKYNEIIMELNSRKDMCRDCVKKAVAENSIGKNDNND